MKKEFLELGQIVGTHGIKGEIKINPWCDTPEFAKKFKIVFLEKKFDNPIKVISCRAHGNLVLMKLSDVNSMDDALLLKNKIVYVSRADISLKEGTWFIEELIGCSVYDIDSNYLYGIISDVSQTGANDVWHITNNEGKEYLIPAIKDVVINVDIDAEKAFIRPLKGIFDNAN